MTKSPAALRVPFLLCALCVFVVNSFAQEVPKVAGSEVPAPKRTKTIAPEYPPEALAQGLRGIVILELVIDPQGKVISAEIVRSVPPFDEAALTAVRKWEYEGTKVEGKPVSVRLTVPISFAMRLPEITRQEGIPELRQGATPALPPGRSGEGAKVIAEVTLDAEGRIAEAEVKSGESPWSDALLQALKTWRFAPDGSGGVLSFRIEVSFVPASRSSPGRVELQLGGLRRSESFDPGTATAASAKPATEPPPAATNEPPQTSSTPPVPSAPSAPPAGPPSTEPAGPPATPSLRPSPTPPPVEVITAPTPRPSPPTEAGVSTIRDVTLHPGVPDLVKGRRPVVPPLARMGGTEGTVEVRFAVDAAGLASVQSVTGPDLLKTVAEQTVASWGFRRASAERLHLVAFLTYAGDTASATVKPQK